MSKLQPYHSFWELHQATQVIAQMEYKEKQVGLSTNELSELKEMIARRELAGVNDEGTVYRISKIN